MKNRPLYSLPAVEGQVLFRAPESLFLARVVVLYSKVSYVRKYVGSKSVRPGASAGARPRWFRGLLLP